MLSTGMCAVRIGIAVAVSGRARATRMSQTVIVVEDEIGFNRSAAVSVRVWRTAAGARERWFGYAGSVDALALGAVMQLVGRLMAANPGDWTVELSAAGTPGDRPHGSTTGVPCPVDVRALLALLA